MFIGIEPIIYFILKLKVLIVGKQTVFEFDLIAISFS